MKNYPPEEKGKSLDEECIQSFALKVLGKQPLAANKVSGGSWKGVGEPGIKKDGGS